MQELLEQAEMEEWREIQALGKSTFVRNSVSKRLPVSIAVAVFISLQSERLAAGIATFISCAAVAAFLSFVFARADWEKGEQRYAAWIRSNRGG